VTAPGVDLLAYDDVREALRLLGRREPPAHRAGALRELREALTDHTGLRAVLDRAPEDARKHFVRLCHDGPAEVADLLGRGWWGHGTLPPPLDWLQHRGLVVALDGLVHASAEARTGLLTPTLGLEARAEPVERDPVRVEDARAVVVAPDEAVLGRALAVGAAALRAVSPTVAVTHKTPAAVTAALRGAGLALDADTTVEASTATPALPGASEEAAGPKAVRALLERATSERRQVRLQYFASSRGGAATDRIVDPWEFRDDLLRGYCHLREGERTFAVDRVGKAVLLPSAIDHFSA
jgi:hypothetical protein